MEEGGRGRKIFSGTGQEKIKPEQGMISNKPELPISCVILIVSKNSRPNLVGAGAYGIIEHIDGCAKLLPKACFIQFIHLSAPCQLHLLSVITMIAHMFK